MCPTMVSLSRRKENFEWSSTAVRSFVDAVSTLNRELLQGPDMSSNLVGILTRFRKDPVAQKPTQIPLVARR